MRGITKKVLVVLTVFTVVGFGAYAFADWGMGPGMMGGWGYHGGYGRTGHGYMMGNLSAEDIQKMDAQREAFLKATEDLRQKLYQKRLALESEFAKKNPDAKNAASLQKDISKLQAQIDQKRINYMIEMKKIYPYAGGRFRGNGPMGYGSSYGHPCWR